VCSAELCGGAHAIAFHRKKCQETTLSLNVLLVASEAVPLAKTGGLGDMVSAYAAALREAGVDATILIPAYPKALQTIDGLQKVAAITGLPGGDGALYRGRMPDTGVPVILLRMDHLYARDGLYQDAKGRDYEDNAIRFASLSAAAVRIAEGVRGFKKPDIVHAHDWHCGLTPLLMKQAGVHAKSVFTIHNLAFQGNYSLSLGAALGVPARWLVPALTDPRSIEFYGALSLMKAGIVHADHVATVSETYAREILCRASSMASMWTRGTRSPIGRSPAIIISTICAASTPASASCNRCSAFPPTRSRRSWRLGAA
jgi:starch synthase